MKIVYPKTLSWIIYGSAFSVITFMVVTAVTYRKSVYWQDKFNSALVSETEKTEELSQLRLLLANTDHENSLLLKDYFNLDSIMLYEKFLNAELNRELIQSLNSNRFLKTENETLRKQVRDYAEKFNLLVDDLHQSRSQIELSRKESDSLNNIIASLSLKDTDMKMSLEFLAGNRLIGVNATGMQQFRKFSKPTTKIRHTDFIEISVTSIENLKFDLGNKTVYYRIADPSGNILPFMKDELDMFRFQGEDILFSEKTSFHFTGNKLPAKINYHPVTQLTPGIYWIYAFCDGIRIGEASFELY